MKILINASNLHVGGGVQVATSIIDELSRSKSSMLGLSILVSEEVDKNLKSIGCNLSKFSSYQIFNCYGLSTLWSGLNRKINKFDIVFTIFGPLYLLSMQPISIVGFAQAWIVYPNNETYFSLSAFEKLKIRLKFFIQSLFFKRADKLVVELEHVREGLLKLGFLDKKRIHVVRNCLNSLYFKPEQWKPLDGFIEKNKYSIGFVGRDYLHKNIKIFPFVKKILFCQYGLDINFYVTFSATEWNAKSTFFKENVVNVGVLNVAQCPTFYQQMDAVIFPSFLECSSATPLEAMFMSKPLFASDRGFVRDVCGDFAVYFDPEDLHAISNVIANYINNFTDSDDARLAAARRHAINFSSAQKRVEDYMEIIKIAVLD